MDPQGPLHIRPSYAPKAAPWLWKFWRQSQLNRVWHNAVALDALNRHSVECHLALARWAGVEHLYKIPGQLYVWTDRKEFEHSKLARAIWERTGQPFEEVDGKVIQDIEPALAGAFEVGLRIFGNGHCKDPYGLCVGLAEKGVAEGMRLLREEVHELLLAGSRIVGVKTDRGTLAAETVVLAGGAWSAELLRQVGLRVPLESQRGYHVTIRNPGVELNNMLLVIDKKIAITPMNSGLRVGGTVEFAGLAAAPDFGRSERLVPLARSLFKDLSAEDYTEWMGHRPCTPDSLPVIGASGRLEGLLCAFGHGHMGLLGSAPTGRIIADIAAGRETGMDMAPYSPDRFG
jgi:D-amino-acid dehydrogenase